MADIPSWLVPLSKKLEGRKKKHMHNKFFSANTNVASITVPIVTKSTGEKKITPYRNTRCRAPECVYDFYEILEIARGFPQGVFRLTCYYCRAELEIDGFYQDETLAEIINQIYERYNNGNKLICQAIKVNRKGFWEPVIPDYVRQLDRNLRAELGKRDIEGNDQSRVFLKNYEDEGQLIKAKVMEKLPSLRDFRKADYERMEEEFYGQKERDPKEVLLDRYDFPLRGMDFDNWRNETSVSEAVVCFFTKYLEEFQINHSRSFTYERGNRVFFMPIIVRGYERFYKTTKFELGKGFSNPYARNPDLLWKNFNLLELVIHYDERWILCIVELKSHTYYLIDFLEEELSRVRQEEVIEIIKNLTHTLFSLKQGPIELINCKKINSYSDCGVHIMNFIYKSLINQKIPAIRIKYLEKENFKQHVGWLMLNLSQYRPKNVVYFNFPEGAGEKNADARNTQGAIPDDIFYFKKGDKTIDWDKEMSKAWTFSETSEIRQDSGTNILPPDISEINSSLSFFHSEKSGSSSNNMKQRQSHNMASPGIEAQSSMLPLKSQPTQGKHLLSSNETSSRPGKAPSLLLPSIDQAKNSILSSNRSNDTLKGGPKKNYIDRTNSRTQAQASSGRSSRKPSGEMLNMNKEDFYEFIRKFKENLKEDIFKRGELFNERGERKIEVKDDQVHMNKDQLKEILRQHEEYLRGKAAAPLIGAEIDRKNNEQKRNSLNGGLGVDGQASMPRNDANPGRMGAGMEFPQNSWNPMMYYGADGFSNNMFGMYPGMDWLYNGYGNFDMIDSESETDEEEEEEGRKKKKKKKTGKGKKKSKRNRD